jgi:hypothetical protein
MESPFLPVLMLGMLVRTRCYRTVGLFDEALLRSEDTDMLLRLARRFRAGRLEHPTFALRQHDGARGPSFQSHAEADRYDVCRQYHARIFRRLRDSLELSEYLPKDWSAETAAAGLTSTERRRALLQRALVMTLHGLLAEALDDLTQYVDELERAKAAPSKKECQQLSTIAYIQNPETMPPPRHYFRLGRIAARGRGPAQAQLRGIYWSALRELRRAHFWLTGRIIGRGTCLLAGCLRSIAFSRG